MIMIFERWTWQEAQLISGLCISFHPGATTVNFALSLRARARIEPLDDGRIASVAAIARLDLEPVSIELTGPPPRTAARTSFPGWSISCRRRFSSGRTQRSSGGSGDIRISALAIALIGALNRLVGKRYYETEFIAIADKRQSSRLSGGIQVLLR